MAKLILCSLLVILLKIAVTATGSEVNGDPCSNNPCENGATCAVRPTASLGYSCQCKRNWGGKNCTRDLYACRSNPCLNGGLCKNRPNYGSFICKCLPGTSGDQCESNFDECASMPCQNNATCLDLVGGFLCSCPKGIVGRLCEMDYSSEIEVSCTSTEMVITLATGLLEIGDVPSSVRLLDERCKGYLDEESNLVKISTAYGDCGTTVQESGDSIIFSNAVHYMEEIVTSHKFLQLPVKCVMGKKEIVDGSSFEITRENATAMKGYGEFKLTLERYTDESFAVLPDSQDVLLRQDLFYAISLESTANLTVLIDDCWATASPDANDTMRYDLIMDACPVDGSLNLYTNIGSLKEGFSFHAFAFIGGFSQVHIHCAVTVCVPSTTNDCQQGCINSPTRNRRNVHRQGLTTNPIST